MNRQEMTDLIRDVITEQLSIMAKSGTPYDGHVVLPGSMNLPDTFGQMQILDAVKGQFISTTKGSVLDLSQPQKPWVKLSAEMQEWAEAFKTLIRTGRVERALEEGSDPKGGYLVPEEFQGVIVQYDTEPVIVWPRATVWPMSRETLGMPKLKQRPDADSDAFDHFAGVSFAWTDEGGTKEETQPEFEFIQMIAHELSGYTEASEALVEDSAINLINFLTGLFRRAYLWYTDRSFIRGNGARCPLGIMNDPAVLTVNRQSTNKVVYQDLLNMDSKLPSVFDAGAVWFASKKVLNSLRGQTDDNGHPVLQQFYHVGPGGIGMGLVASMLGYPVVRSDNKTYSLGQKGDIVLGNWQWYYIGDRRQFKMDMSSHYKFRSNKRAFRVCGRLDGAPACSEAFVVLDSEVGTS